MQTICKIFLVFLLMLIFRPVFAQNSDDAGPLVKEGVQLNKDGKYAEAIEKYSQALKIDPENVYANYGIAYSLFNSGKGKDAVPYLEKVTKANTSITAWAYDLLGSIYDKDHESGKAIEAYNNGIKADPKYQRIHYNLGLVYFRDKKYADAEKCAVDAIKLDPKHANSQRMYALVTFHQNKRAAALLGFCSFILLEPNTARSAEAFGNIQHILQGGVLKIAPGEAMLMPEANTIALNLVITQAVAEAGKEKYATTADLLAAQLKNIFMAVGQLAEKQTGDDFFRKCYAAYFYQLAQSSNMPAFSRMINSNSPESTKWINDHPQYMNDLYTWVKTAEREF
jgi:Flp pilus assembly protein TadD